MGRRCNNFGHTPRDEGKGLANGKYCVMGGDDNYYTPNFVKELKDHCVDSPGMVYWDMIHSHYGYVQFKCSPFVNQIDIGAFATRSDLGKQIHMTSSFVADGEFVENFKRTFPKEKLVKIYNKIMYVHN